MFSPQEYYKKLEEAKEPVPIRHLLSMFGLPSTSSGRQRFRDANSAFNKQFEGKASIEPVWMKLEVISPDPETGEALKKEETVKAFQLVFHDQPTEVNDANA